MTGPQRTISLRTKDLPAFRTAVIACAEQGEHERCERLLGQLASLETTAPATLAFVPAPGTGALARRALAHLGGGRTR